jgi:5-carboxymethyl-2-hydroxymuconate isomerase
LDGRTEAQKQGLGKALLRKLEQQTYFKLDSQFPIQLCVEMIDIPKQNYFKAMIQNDH